MSDADSTVTPPAGAAESAKLHRRALGVPDLVFLSSRPRRHLPRWRVARPRPT